MNWSNIVVQLGISALVLFVVYKIGMLLINRNAESTKERNRIYADAEKERTIAIKEGFAADMSAHQQIAVAMQTLSNYNNRIEGKLDTVLDLTPVRGILRMQDINPSIADDLPATQPKKRTPASGIPLHEQDTPLDRPTIIKQPRAQSPVGIYGPTPPKRR